MNRILTQGYFSSRDTACIARSLLGKFLVVDNGMKRAYIITEVEAYDGFSDKASHAHRGMTERNMPMFGAPGTWYVYFVYGMHWMLNIVTGPKSYPGAILIRGVQGISGPGKLTKLLNINGSHNTLVSGKRAHVWIEDRGLMVPKSAIRATPRIGVSYAGSWAKKPYRFVLSNNAWLWKEMEKIILRSGVGVIPTDTLYGIVASAFSKKAVERVYALRGRNPKKPCIILISDVSDLQRFGITLSQKDRDVVQRWWPGPVSVIFSPVPARFSYLHRGTSSLAFRIPNDKKLRGFINSTGPLIAPSANKEGEAPACTVLATHTVFGDAIGMHIDGGLRTLMPSTVVTLQDGVAQVVRQGAFRI
jgi:DNA-3-methyladenine glycosylase